MLFWVIVTYWTVRSRSFPPQILEKTNCEGFFVHWIPISLSFSFFPALLFTSSRPRFSRLSIVPSSLCLLLTCLDVVKRSYHLITAWDSNVDFFSLVFIRKEEQIKKDEQFARVLQEQIEPNSSTTPPETRGNELPSQTRVNGDQQGNEQVRRGQVRVELTVII